MNRVSSLCLLLLAVVSNQAYAGFDHELPLDQNGVWTRCPFGHMGYTSFRTHR